MALATLSIDIVAQLARMQDDLGKATRLNERAAAQIEARWGRVDRVMRGFGATLAGAFSAQAIAAFATDTLKALDALNDASDATGATIENLSALEDIARKNGGTLNEVTAIVVKFNNVLKEADGKNAVSQALKAIGVDVRELRRLDPAEALQKVAVALDGFEDSGSKARIVQELFGKSVREAAPFLKDLAEAGKLHATVTTEQAKQAERLNKHLAEFQTNANNAARSLLSSLVPAMNEWIKQGEAARKVFGNGFTAFRELGFQGIFGDDLTGLQEARAELEKINATLASIQSGKVSSTSFYGADRVEPLKRQQAELAKVVQYYEKLFGMNGNAGAGRGVGGADLSKPTLPDIVDRMPKKEPPDFLGQSWDAWQKRLDDWRERNEEVLDRIEEADQKLSVTLATPESSRRGATQDQAERVRQSIADLNSVLESTPTAQIQRLENMLDALREASNADPQQVAEATQSLNESIQRLRDEIDPAAREMQESLGTSLKMALKGDFDDILAMWQDMLLEMAAQAAAAEFMQRIFGQGEGASGGWGKVFDLILGSKNGNAFNANGVVPFANGGVVDRATLFGFGNGRTGVMGEAGPEAILPLRRGRDGRLGIAGGGSANFGIGTIVVGEGVSEARVGQVVAQALRAQEVRFMRLKREGRF